MFSYILDIFSHHVVLLIGSQLYRFMGDARIQFISQFRVHTTQPNGVISLVGVK